MYQGIVECLNKMAQQNWKRLPLLHFAVVAISIHLANSFPGHADEISHLPGLPSSPNFKQYSGYLKATGDNFFHYWFTESEHRPSSDPLVLWLNGGPGCSSLGGLMTELGPFYVNKDAKTLRYNPYSWNKIANVLFLESPAGVGYSYSTDRNYNTNDSQVAVDNHAALLSFFEKFPQYQSRDFFITGESYAGIYIPTLLTRLIRDDRFNLKDIAIGNGYMNPGWLQDHLFFYWYYHGILGDKLWKELVSSCCNHGNQSDCHFFPPAPNKDCQLKAAEATIAASSVPIDPYNIYLNPEAAGSSKSDRIIRLISFMLKQASQKFDDKEARLEFHKFFRKLSDRTSTCKGGDVTQRYLNDPAVRKALHIPDDLPCWTNCGGTDSFEYKEMYEDMTPQFLEVLNTHKYRFLIYNGDLDTVCNFFGDQFFVDQLKQKEVKAHHPWYFTASDGTKQIGGFARQFKNIDFITVKGAGHMVPRDQPVASLEMFRRLLKKENF